ncbi:hypothetical protein CBS147321_1043 [Aspergillus niger]|nr:hypothetical protein CBS133816_8557 [Aspergillus niger]KAI2943089.1 hypothetical protein CBS147322_8620 [Aspergillus niger]KAI2951631.1 hypothetical protein CBS147321_1043 [Aspergillus niger]KAI2962522.1 hypothetical protein CBS147324_9402 [Aspergillus niger]
MNRLLGAEAPSTLPGYAGISSGSDHTSPVVPNGLPGTWFPSSTYPFEVSIASQQPGADSSPAQTRPSSGSFSNPIEIDFGSPSLPDSSTCLLNQSRAGDSIDNPIEIGDDDSVFSTDGFLTQLTRAGDTIDHPIYIDDVTTETATDNDTGHSGCGSGLEPLSDIQAEFLCKICYSQAVDLVLGCGHTICHECFVHYVHESVLADNDGLEYLAEKRFLIITRNLAITTMSVVVASFL